MACLAYTKCLTEWRGFGSTAVPALRFRLGTLCDEFGRDNIRAGLEQSAACENTGT